MKLFSIVEDDKMEKMLSERKTSLAIDDEPVKRPIGISVEEFTDEYKSHLEDIKMRRPELYKKIVQGH